MGETIRKTAAREDIFQDVKSTLINATAILLGRGRSLEGKAAGEHGIAHFPACKPNFSQKTPSGPKNAAKKGVGTPPAAPLPYLLSCL